MATKYIDVKTAQQVSCPQSCIARLRRVNLKQEKHDEEIVKTTLRLPKSMSDKVKHAAIDEGCSQQELVERALRTYFKQKGGRQ